MHVIEYCRVHISSVIHEQCTLNISYGICTTPGSISRIHRQYWYCADSIIDNNKCLLVSYHTEVGTPTLSYQYWSFTQGLKNHDVIPLTYVKCVHENEYNGKIKRDVALQVSVMSISVWLSWCGLGMIRVPKPPHTAGGGDASGRAIGSFFVFEPWAYLD